MTCCMLPVAHFRHSRHLHATITNLLDVPWLVICPLGRGEKSNNLECLLSMQVCSYSGNLPQKTLVFSLAVCVQVWSGWRESPVCACVRVCEAGVVAVGGANLPAAAARCLATPQSPTSSPGERMFSCSPVLPDLLKASPSTINDDMNMHIINKGAHTTQHFTTLSWALVHCTKHFLAL